MIWIIGGTSEGRKLVDRIEDLDNFLVTVATESGKDFIDSDRVRIGRMNYREMQEFIDREGISLIIDLSHPFAKIVSDKARRAAREKSIDYIRYTREVGSYKNVINLPSYQEAYEYLKDIEGNVFFTTGCKNIGDFEKVRGKNRFIYRIIPARESIEECIKNKVHIRDIVALVGPFSKEYNKIMFKEHQADFVIMKDSGRSGGTLEKVQACQELGIRPLIINREEEEGVSSLDELEEIIRGFFI